jgi:precorrin-6B C5,15-methyltransferase / cobalt-precorrin-6B C5,C15-methyltransferase
MTPEPLFVIGLGADGPATLSEQARENIQQAGILAGGKRHLDLFPDWNGERIVITADLDGAIARLKDSYRRVKTVVLASGDPLFFGIGRVLLQAFPREDLVFLPQASSVQLAFARLKETWNDACVVSLHGRPIETLLSALAAKEAKIAILTDAKNDPSTIACYLQKCGCAADYHFWVCENLGAADERISLFRETEVYSPLNIMVLLRKAATASPPVAPLIGIPDHALAHRLLTKREIRLLVLAYLELQVGQVVWDIGAGSGAVSIEMGRLSPKLQVHAIEKDPQALSLIQENVRRFLLGNVRVVAGEAPEALAGLPDPDRVFIGGSGGRLADILETVFLRMKPTGRLVLNCITLETFNIAWSWLTQRNWCPEATSVQLSHAQPLGNLHSFEADRPLFIIRAGKPACV